MQIFRSLLIVLLICCTSIYASDNPVHEYQLKNGLKVFVKEDHRAPVVITEIWYKVGSSYEPDGITGISHALEHMMFRGSKNYDAKRFLQIISENGGDQNAFTSFDYTGYYEMLAADKLPISFKLEADRMRNLLLRPEDFAKEIQVVMEERRMRIDDDPQQLTFERFLAAAHVSNSYHHPLIGWMNDLQNMKVEDLQHWYQTWYAPNNALIVVVGDVKPDDVYQLAQKYFGDLKPATIPTLKPLSEAPSLGTRTVVVAAPAKLPWLTLGYNTPVVKTASEAWEPYALLVLNVVLGGSDSSRLQQDLVRDKQIAATIDAGYSPYDRLDNIFIIQATPATGHSVAEVKDAVLAEVQKLQQQPITPAELARVKAQIIANKIYQEDSITYQAYEIGSLESIGLSWRETDHALKAIDAITPEQVQAVAKKYLIPARLTIGELKPLPINTQKMPATYPTGKVGDTNVH